MLDQQRDVVAPVAQRRQRDREHVQAVVQVLAKAPGLHLGLAGRGWSRRPRARRPCIVRDAADALDLAVPAARAAACPAPRRLSVADLVQEQRAAVRALEAPRTRAGRAGEGARVDAEQLALDQVSGMAAQLTATNGLPARGLTWCSARANSSLPTPDSPANSTVARVGATRSSICRATLNAAETPTIPPPSAACPGAAPGLAGASADRRVVRRVGAPERAYRSAFR